VFTKPTGTITFLDGSTPLDNTPIALVPNTFASATLQKEFGTPDATFTTLPSLWSRASTEAPP
jgi:hypothetical protein